MYCINHSRYFVALGTVRRLLSCCVWLLTGSRGVSRLLIGSRGVSRLLVDSRGVSCKVQERLYNYVNVIPIFRYSAHSFFLTPRYVYLASSSYSLTLPINAAYILRYLTMHTEPSDTNGRVINLHSSVPLLSPLPSSESSPLPFAFTVVVQYSVHFLFSACAQSNLLITYQ